MEEEEKVRENMLLWRFLHRRRKTGKNPTEGKGKATGRGIGGGRGRSVVPGSDMLLAHVIHGAEQREGEMRPEGVGSKEKKGNETGGDPGEN